MTDHRAVHESNLEKLELLLVFCQILALVFWVILVAVLVMYSGAIFDIFHFIAEMTRR